jgi:gliding motility-associated-like protein
MNQDDGCETLNVSFTNNSFSPIPGFPITSWNWNFGNGNTSNLQNPPSQLYNLGVYNVSLTITTANGCTATLDSLGAVEVGIPPIVSFTVQPDTICARQTLDLVNLSSINVPHQQEEVEYFWYLGDQGPFSDFEPSNEPILDTGWIDVTLIVSFRGCKDTLILQNEVFVHGPLISFSHPTILCNPTIPVSVEIQDATVLGQQNDSVAVTWWLGDGSTLIYNADQAWQNNQATFNHIYQNYGDYTIKQKAWNYENGCIDSLEQVIRINWFQTNLNVLNDSVCFGGATNFNWTHQSIEFYPIASFTYFTDGVLLGTSISGQITNPDDFTFLTSGVHEILVDATNVLGCTSSSSKSLYVAPLPEAEIELLDVVGCVPTEATFQDASNSISGVPVVGYQWSCSGTEFSSPTQNPFTAAIAQSGSFTTNLTVTDALGCSGSTVLITDFLAPEASFEVPPVVCNNTPFYPTNLSQNFAQSMWYFNNQLLSDLTSPELVFNFPTDPNVLSYEVVLKLIVSDGFGCFDEIEVPLIVSSPYANFSYQLTGANTDEFGNFTCPSVFGQFTDLSQSMGAVSTWNWVFGDGKTSTFQNPSNTYVFSGVYTSSLTITDEFGCQDSIVFPEFLTISGPSGVFGWIPGGTACDPNFIFQVYDTSNVNQIQWFPGDGSNFSALEGGEYLYPSSGAFEPFVIISDNNNCSVTYPLDTLTVQFGNLNADFYVNPTEFNWGVPLSVVNESSGGIGGIINNQWFFGDHTFNNNQNQFSYFFNQAGSLDIFLVVTDSLGCTDTATTTVFVSTQLAFPNVFTPNGDGSNDVFTFIFNAYREYEVIILNRWGNIMSQRFLVDESYLWDGKAPNGEMAAEGVYYYHVKGILRDNTSREDYGFFHLVLE